MKIFANLWMLTNKHHSVTLTSFLFLIFMSLLLTGCGNSGYKPVTNVTVTTKTLDQDVYVNLKAQFNLGNTTLPSVTFPVVNPKSPSEIYGSISMAPTLDGKSEVSLDINFTQITHLQGGKASLPNGTALPIGGINGVEIVELLIPNTLAKVYIGIDQNVAIAGFALAIKELDQIGNTIGGVNLFPSFSFGKIKGVGGIFTGKTSGTTGIALFVDLSSVLNQEQIFNLSHGSFASLKSTSMKSIIPASEKKSKLEKFLMKIGLGTKKTLTVK